MSGSKTISTSDTKLEALSLQSSAYGVTVPLLYGMNRIAGNMVWYGGFKATAHTTTQSQGGKGGGVKTQNTTYTYSASVMMGLCEGQITDIPRIWKGKQLYSGGATAGNLATVGESYTVPTGGGTFMVAHSAAFAANIGVSVPGTGSGDIGDNGWTLAEGVHYTRVGGVYTFPAGAADGLTVTVTYQYTYGSIPQTAMAQLGLSFSAGAIAQPTWAYLTTNFSTQAIGYSGLAMVYAQDYALGTTAQVDNHTFEVMGPQAYSISSTIPDANPASAAWDALINGRYGAAFPSGMLENVTPWSSYCLASGLLLSPALETQIQASEFVATMGTLTNTAPVWSGGKLKMIPYGDVTLTANGATYTPNTTPIYDLTDDDYLGGGDPIKVSRKPQSDAYNHIRIEFVNRANLYNVEIAEAKDSANIDVNGLRSASIFSAHWICDANIARTVAQIMLQRAVYVRNTYTFTLAWTKALLEPMDLVTLTDSGLGFNKLPVRIIEIAESENGDLAVVAEEYPQGVASTTLYTTQVGAGFQHNYSASPGSVSAPVFFEAPVELTLTGLEVYAAVSGAGAYWGGCRVWASQDGTNYKNVTTLNGGARYGKLSAALSGGTLPVLTTGQLISGSAADAAALNTLCYLGGATPEYLAYQTATLTGAGAYTLAGLVRGAYSTSQASAHATNDPFVRVDSAIVKGGPLDLAMIGKTIYFKFTSFNIYGAAEESLAAVTAYPYTITGAMAALPPSAVTGLAAVAQPFGIGISCNRNPEPDVVSYEYRQGATFAGAVVIEPAGGTSYLWKVQAAGSYTLWARAQDFLGNYSTPVSTTATITGGTIGGLSSSIIGPNIALSWTAASGSFVIDHYELRVGASWAAGAFVDTTKATSDTVRAGAAGSAIYWVAAVDAAGNYGAPSGLNVTINIPGSVTGVSSTVVDNNALLYWSAPAIGAGQLQIDRYEVRKGASWAAGAVVGSNGNSTFTTVFEQQSGTYTYWVAPVDTGGNYGTAAGIIATINQPPDYVLRNNYDSALAGTWVNFYQAIGKWVGPLDLTQTWATHFSSHSWASPNDQIVAGFPLYAEPSLTSGSYEETIDYGASIPPTVITATINAAVVGGSVTSTCTLSWKLNIGDAWTVLTAGTTSALLPTFRYVRVHYDFACTAGANLLQVNGLNVKLAIKLRNDSGSGTAVTGGTAVTFGYPFIAADTPLVQPQGSTPLIPVVIFSGGANPTGFTVRLYNLAGSDVGGPFSWTARGY